MNKSSPNDTHTQSKSSFIPDWTGSRVALTAALRQMALLALMNGSVGLPAQTRLSNQTMDLTFSRWQRAAPPEHSEHIHPESRQKNEPRAQCLNTPRAFTVLHVMYCALKHRETLSHSRQWTTWERFIWTSNSTSSTLYRTHHSDAKISLHQPRLKLLEHISWVHILMHIQTI